MVTCIWEASNLTAHILLNRTLFERTMTGWTLTTRRPKPILQVQIQIHALKTFSEKSNVAHSTLNSKHTIRFSEFRVPLSPLTASCCRSNPGANSSHIIWSNFFLLTFHVRREYIIILLVVNRFNTTALSAKFKPHCFWRMIRHIVFEEIDSRQR